jgi:hypothetical protein
MSRVFVIQGAENRFDFKPAERFGELVFVLDMNDSVFRLDDTLTKLSQRMSGFTKDDYILPIGNPVLIGAATALAADQTGGDFHMLQWLGREKEYIPIKVSLWSVD